MDFDGNQPIRILFWNDEMFTKQKHMIIKRRSIAILRRRLQDRARVRRRATRSWLLRRKQRSTYNIKNCTLKNRTSSEIILEWTKIRHKVTAMFS
jgi:hypothetical protein